MNAALRHLSLRLWITAFAGGLANVIVLPWWQRLFNLEGILIPVALLLIASFAATGWVLDKVGLFFLQRLVNEAAVWEQAGMTAEAEAVYQRAVGLFDSFWFSPMQRRRRTPWFTARLARFYIGQSLRNSYADALVRGYLLKHPDDADIASAWLEQLLNRKRHTQIDHEAAARIGEALVDDLRIQQLLMEFYLTNGRIDFHAVKTYQRVWWQRQPLPEGLLKPLLGLLLQESLLTHWTLQVYLEALKKGHQEALEGVAGCACWLHPTVENRQNLQAAKNALAKYDAEDVASLARRFKPVQPDKAVPRPRPSKKRVVGRQLEAKDSPIADQVSRAVNAFGSWAVKYGQAMSAIVFTRRAAIGITIGAAVMGMVVVGRQMIKAPVEPPVPVVPTVEAPLPVEDPFTIQVAAYLKSDDAQRFVDQLKQHGLDAFWTEATSANRKWYQVKVSHFATKDQAMQYGQELKSKGLIDDYYVANYKALR
ncbi:MAG: SPOR domain-containing protein [Desulfobacteraceae bacterium]|jgi:cell division septation protein DedD